MTQSDLNSKKNSFAFWVDNRWWPRVIGRSREIILLDQKSEFKGLEFLERTSWLCCVRTTVYALSPSRCLQACCHVLALASALDFFWLWGSLLLGPLLHPVTTSPFLGPPGLSSSHHHCPSVLPWHPLWPWHTVTAGSKDFTGTFTYALLFSLFSFCVL